MRARSSCRFPETPNVDIRLDNARLAPSPRTAAMFAPDVPGLRQLTAHFGSGRNFSHVCAPPCASCLTAAEAPALPLTPPEAHTSTTPLLRPILSDKLDRGLNVGSA